MLNIIFMLHVSNTASCFSFSRQIIFMISARNATVHVSANSKQVGLRHSCSVNVLFFGSEFLRHPEGPSFSRLGSKFSRSEFLRHPANLFKI